MPHGRHIYATADDMVMSTMCIYPPSQHAFPNCKCLLRCCSNFPRIDLLYQELNKHYSDAFPSIIFHIYHLIVQCTVHGRRPKHEKKKFVCVFKIRLL